MITDLQKASILKRIAAGIFDLILLCVFSVGFAWMLTEVLDYSTHSEQLSATIAQYEESYNVDLNISESEYNALSEADQQRVLEASKALQSDKSVQETSNLLLNLLLIITTFGILLAVVLLEFVIPLVLKNGQTIGKKIFAIGLVRIDSVQLTPVQLFTRTILGKFTVEIMVPVYIIIMMYFGSANMLGIILLFGIPLAQLVSIIASRTNSLIHDKMAGTVAVDIASQMIFRTPDDLIAYKKKIHAEQAARSNY